jgi:hypothetical protein
MFIEKRRNYVFSSLFPEYERPVASIGPVTIPVQVSGEANRCTSTAVGPALPMHSLMYLRLIVLRLLC